MGAFAIGLLLAIGRGRPAWSEWRRRTISEAADAMRQEHEVGAAMANLPRTLDTLQARAGLLAKAGALVLSGDSPADASGSFSALVAEAAHRSRIRVSGVSVRADTGHHELAHLRIDLDGTGDIAGLATFLSTIERGPTLVSVPRLVVRATNGDADTLDAEQLSLQMTLEAIASIRRARDSQ